MQRIKDLTSELMNTDFTWATCCISSQCLSGEFEVKKVYLKDSGEFLEPNLIIDVGSGSFSLDIDSLIEKLDKPPYKWGYKIISTNIDNEPTEHYSIEIGKKYTVYELTDMEL